jgi:hypothetical protein
MIDVSPVVLEAQAVVLQAAGVFERHTGPWLIGLLIHGSALKGGFIPGCSDIDLQLYLKDEALEPDGSFPVSLGIAIQRDLAQIDPAPFQYIQCYELAGAFMRARFPDWIGPIPGAYHMLTGHLPIPEATEEQVQQRAKQRLESIATVRGRVASGLLQHGGGKLPRAVRFLCTDIWPTLYSMLSYQADRPFDIWRLPKEAAIALLPETDSRGRAIRLFHQAVWHYYTADQSIDAALAVIEQGVLFLRAAEEWFEGNNAEKQC